MRRGGRSGPEASFHVFISYRRSDSGPYARNVYDALTQHFGADSTFFDIDSIAPGRDFVDVLDETLTRADVLLVVMGPAWAAVTDDGNERRIDDPHDYVRLEVETALKSDDVRVIPVLVGGATMPPANVLPESLASLTRRNATSLVDEHWRSTMDELVAVLERIRDERAAAPATPSTGRSADASTAKKRRTWAIIGGIAALVVIGLGIFAFAAQSDSGTNQRGLRPGPTTAPQTTTPATTTTAPGLAGTVAAGIDFLAVHEGPSVNAAAIGDGVPPGQSVSIDCWKKGDVVTRDGYEPDDLWDHVAYGNLHGYATAAYIDVSDADITSKLPECAG